MKKMCPPGYDYKGFVVTHAMHLGTLCTVHHKRKSCAQVHWLPESHCGNNHEGTLKLKSLRGDCSNRDQITLAADFLYFIYFHLP